MKRINEISQELVSIFLMTITKVLSKYCGEKGRKKEREEREGKRGERRRGRREREREGERGRERPDMNYV